MLLVDSTRRARNSVLLDWFMLRQMLWITGDKHISKSPSGCRVFGFLGPLSQPSKLESLEEDVWLAAGMRHELSLEGEVARQSEMRAGAKIEKVLRCSSGNSDAGDTRPRWRPEACQSHGGDNAYCQLVAAANLKVASLGP